MARRSDSAFSLARLLYRAIPLLLFLSVALEARSENAPHSPEYVLNEIRGIIEEREADLQRLRADEAGVNRQLDAVRSELKSLNIQKAGLEAELSKIEIERKRAEVELAENSQKFQANLELASSRVRAIYLHRIKSEEALRLASFSMLLESGDSHHPGDKQLRASNSLIGLPVQRAMLRRIREADQLLLQELQLSSTKLSMYRVELDSIAKQKVTIKSQIQERQRVLTEKEGRQRELSEELKRNLMKIRAQLDLLKEEELRIEGIIASITGGDEPKAARVIDRQSPPVDSVTAEERVELVGLGNLKGKLPMPLESWVLVADFGKAPSKQVGIETFKKGILLKAIKGSEVRSIAPGKVAFSGRMPLLGHVVVLEHGERYYSLYGKLDLAKVPVGKFVREGDVVGEIGVAQGEWRSESGKSETNSGELYLEIRQGGKAVDPKPYLSMKG